MNVQQRRLRTSVVFVGMMGAGKTTVARGIAKIFNVPFADTDKEIERVEGMPVSAIFASRGEAYFRNLETDTIRNCLRDGPKSVAVGGGAYLREDNRRIIESSALTVWLRADTGTLWSRVRHKSTRPLLRTENPFATLGRLAEERNPAYSLAKIHVLSEDAALKTETVQKTVNALLSAPEELGIFM